MVYNQNGLMVIHGVPLPITRILFPNHPVVWAFGFLVSPLIQPVDMKL